MGMPGTWAEAERLQSGSAGVVVSVEVVGLAEV